MRKRILHYNGKYKENTTDEPLFLHTYASKYATKTTRYVIYLARKPDFNYQTPYTFIEHIKRYIKKSRATSMVEYVNTTDCATETRMGAA